MTPNYTYSDDPDSAIKNKFGARTHDELERLEGPFVAARETELMDSRPIPGNFDAGHLKSIHRHLFQDVFEWAGHTRDEKVPLSDGTVATEPLLRKVDGKLFMVAPMIHSALNALADKHSAGPWNALREAVETKSFQIANAQLGPGKSVSATSRSEAPRPPMERPAIPD